MNYKDDEMMIVINYNRVPNLRKQLLMTAHRKAIQQQQI